MHDYNRPVTVYEWQVMFREIFGQRNDWMHSPESIVFKLVVRIGKVLNDAKREKPVNPVDLASIGGRIFAISNYLGCQLFAQLAYKYPNFCIRCGEQICVCGPKSNNKAKDVEIDLTDPSFRGLELQDLYLQLNSTYHFNNVASGGITRAAERMLIEASEVVGAMDDPRSDGVEIGRELADVFAWWLATCDMAGVENITDLMWRIYPGTCSMCHRRPCTCQPSRLRS